MQEIEENQRVNAEQADADPGETAEELEELPGQKRGGDGQCEVFAPGLFEIEANCFSEGDGGVSEGEEADAAQDRIVYERGLFKDEADEAGLGIEAEMAGEEFNLVGNIFMEQAVRAESDGYKEQRMEKLVGRDEKQQPVMVPVL